MLPPDAAVVPQGLIRVDLILNAENIVGNESPENLDSDRERNREGNIVENAQSW